MAAEFENVRVAWEWAAQHGKVDRLDQAVAGLCLYGQLRYRSQEAQRACGLAADKLAQMGSPAIALDNYFKVLARIQTWQAAMSLLLGQRAEGKSLLQKSLDLLNRPEVMGQDTRRERALALGLLADTASPKWAEARCLREQSVALSRELGDDFEAAERLIGLGIYEKILGQYDSARQHFEESLALFEKLGHPTGPVQSLNELGMLARDIGRDEEARQYFEKSLALSQARGNLWGIANSRQHLAWLALFHGRFEEAVDHLRPAQAIYSEVGDHGSAYGALRNIAVAYWLLGRFIQANELLDQVVLFYQQGGDLSILADVIALQAEVCAGAGQYEKARSLAHHALGLAHHLWDIREPIAKAQRALGWVALAQAAWDEAHRHFQEAITIYRAMGGQYGQEYLALTLAGLSRAEHGLGNQVKARQHLSEALGIVLTIGAFIPSLFLMPMVSLLLASQGEAEQAVTFYTMASRYPFVAHSCLIQDLVGPNMATAAASLPPDVYQQAIARGQALAWWAAAAELRTAWLELDQGH
jgi:tetratricopeptide (TPR) repeat protein